MEPALIPVVNLVLLFVVVVAFLFMKVLANLRSARALWAVVAAAMFVCGGVFAVRLEDDSLSQALALRSISFGQSLIVVGYAIGILFGIVAIEKLLVSRGVLDSVGSSSEEANRTQRERTNWLVLFLRRSAFWLVFAAIAIAFYFLVDL